MHAAAPETLEYDPGPHKLQAATLDAPDTVDQQTIRVFDSIVMLDQRREGVMSRLPESLCAQEMQY